MTIATIEIPDKKTTLVKQLLKELGVTVKIEKVAVSKNKPNAETQKAIEAARAGKTKKIKNLDSFFKSL